MQRRVTALISVLYVKTYLVLHKRMYDKVTRFFPPLLSLVQANFPFFFIPAMHIFDDYIESELYSQERTGYFVFSCVGLQNTTYPKCRLCLWTSKAFRDQVSLKDQVKSLLAFAVAIGHTVFSFRVQGGMDFIG